MSGTNRIDKRAVGYATALAIALFATLAAAVAGRSLVQGSYADLVPAAVAWLPESTAASLCIMAALAAVAGVGAYMLFSRFEPISRMLGRAAGPRWLPLGFTPRNIAVAAAVLFVAWLPILVLMYPTGLTADTFNQLYQYQTSAPTYYPTTGDMVNAEFIDHHPVFDTLLYGVFWQMGAAFGNGNAGLFALVLLQSIVLAAEMAALICYLQRLRVPYPLRLAALVFVAWFPLFGHYAATVLKDVTYLTVFLPFSLMWMETMRTRGASMRDPRFLVVFMLLGGMSVLAKKLGAFVLAPCLVVLVVALRGQRARIAAVSAATLVVFCGLLPTLVYPAVGGVAPGGRQETLGPAIQHVCALLKENPKALDSDERAVLDRIIDVDEALDEYEPFRSDGAKGAFRAEATSDDIAAFMGLWASQGLRHPVTYLKSTAMTAGMLYVPFLKMTYYSGEDLSGRARNYAKRNADFAVDVGQPQELVELNDYLEFESIESRISDLPIVSLLFTSGFYGSWVPLIALIGVLYARSTMRATRKGKRRKAPLLLTGLVPTLLCMAFLLVSPVASPRYVLPLLFTAPLLLGWAWFALSEAHD